jgi:hypothetical protein
MTKTAQDQMPLYDGLAAGVNQYGQISNMQWVPKVITTVVDLTLTASQSGSFIVNTAATEAEINLTLPAIADGPYVFFVLNFADVNLKVTSETADTLITFNDLAADSVSYETSSEKIGGGFLCVCDGTSVAAIPIGTGGHVQTLTVTTA